LRFNDFICTYLSQCKIHISTPLIIEYNLSLCKSLACRESYKFAMIPKKRDSIYGEAMCSRLRLDASLIRELFCLFTGLDPHRRRVRVRLLSAPLSYSTIHLLYSSYDNRSYQNAQIFPCGRHIHGKPTKSQLSVDASRLLKELCICTAF
jgi:hypothetical protein